MTSALTNQRRVFKACLAQMERVSDDVTRKIGPMDFTLCFVSQKGKNSTLLFDKKIWFLTPLGPMGVRPYRFEKNSV